MISGRALGRRTHVDEMDVDAIDRRHELQQGVQFRLRLAPVVVRAPVANERLQRSSCTLRWIRTVSRSGHRVAAMRRRRSASACSGMSTWKGRMAVSRARSWPASWAAARAAAGSRPKAPRAAELTRKPRRLRDDDVADMISSPSHLSSWTSDSQSPALSADAWLDGRTGDQPKVNAKASTPGPRNSISTWRSEMGLGCRISWYSRCSLTVPLPCRQRRCREQRLAAGHRSEREIAPRLLALPYPALPDP